MQQERRIVRKTYINRVFHNSLDMVGIKVDKGCGVHLFRHSFATYLADMGLNGEAVSYYLGHADESTTDKYYIHGKTERAMHKCTDSGFFNMVS